MGQESSTLSSFEGLQISRVQHASPAFEAGLIPYFDFIIGVDTVALDPDNYSFFYEYVKKSENKQLKLRVFNIRIRVEREVTVTPRDWSGDRKNGLMGFNVSWESAEKAIESTWHITNVAPNSPASKADLMTTRDYLLGMQLPADFATMTVFKDSSEFHTRLEEWRMVQEAISIQKPGSKCSLLMLIFDSIANEVKEIIVEMSSPTESLGIEVANGYLHVVPPTPGSTSLPRLTRCVVTKPSGSSAHQNQQQQQQAPAKPDFDQDQVQNNVQPQMSSDSTDHHEQQRRDSSRNSNTRTSPAKSNAQHVATAPALPTFNHQQQQQPTASSSGSIPSSASSMNSSFPQPPPPTPSNQQQNQNQHQQQQYQPIKSTSLPPPPNFTNHNNNNNTRPPMNSLPAFSAPSLPPPPKF